MSDTTMPTREEVQEMLKAFDTAGNISSTDAEKHLTQFPRILNAYLSLIDEAEWEPQQPAPDVAEAARAFSAELCDSLQISDLEGVFSAAVRHFASLIAAKDREIADLQLEAQRDAVELAVATKRAEKAEEAAAADEKMLDAAIQRFKTAEAQVRRLWDAGALVDAEWSRMGSASYSDDRMQVAVDALRSALAAVPAAESEYPKRASDAHPPAHKQYVVRNRQGKFFTATVCYGMHDPWWIVHTLQGEVPPVAMQDEEWWPLESFRPLPAPPAATAQYDHGCDQPGPAEAEQIAAAVKERGHEAK